MANSFPIRRQVIVCTIGTLFEWYEFTVFASLTPLISTLFFPGSSRFTAMMATLAIFASGYLMRPLGAVFFGHLGDTIGRKQALLATLSLMTVATTLIGLIPVGSVFSTTALVLCRLVQGFATSGEYPGGLALLSEQPSRTHRAFIASFGIAATGFGCFLGAVAYALLSSYLGESEMFSWGWRLLFLLAAPLGVLGYVSRRLFLESPAFEVARQQMALHRIPLVPLIQKHYRNLLALFCLTNLTNALVYINFVYLCNQAVEAGHLSSDSRKYLYMVVTFVYSVMVLLSGFLSDRWNRKKIMMAGGIVLILVIVPLLAATMHGGMAAWFLAGIVLSLLLGIMVGPSASVLPDSFPTDVRYSGISLILNCSGAFFGGTAPMICTALVAWTGSLLAPAGYIIPVTLMALVGLICLKPLPEQEAMNDEVPGFVVA